MSRGPLSKGERCLLFDSIVKSKNKTAQKKDPVARRANPEE
jgi:hypothetical protein